MAAKQSPFSHNSPNCTNKLNIFHRSAKKEDDRHLRKLDPFIDLASKVNSCLSLYRTRFLRNYQALRNVSRLNSASGDCLLDFVKTNVIVMHIEDLIDKLDSFASLRSEPGLNPLAEFRAKYFPPTSEPRPVVTSAPGEDSTP